MGTSMRERTLRDEREEPDLCHSHGHPTPIETQRQKRCNQAPTKFEAHRRHKLEGTPERNQDFRLMYIFNRVKMNPDRQQEE